MNRVLLAYSSKRGGTAGIAHTIGRRLTDQGIRVDVIEADRVRSLTGYDAIIVGSALYNGRWQRPAVRLLKRLAPDAPGTPVWLFHSGPLGDEEQDPQRLPEKIAKLAPALGARPVVTFGGRLEAEPGGFIATAMARNGRAGDWRDQDRIRAWADEIARSLAAEV